MLQSHLLHSRRGPGYIDLYAPLAPVLGWYVGDKFTDGPGDQGV